MPGGRADSAATRKFSAKLSTSRAFLSRLSERPRSEEHTSELQSQSNLVCRLLLEKKKHTNFRLLALPNFPKLYTPRQRAWRTPSTLPPYYYLHSHCRPLPTIRPMFRSPSSSRTSL